MSKPALTQEQLIILLKSKESRIKELELQLKAANIKIQELQKSKFRRHSDSQDIHVTAKNTTFALNEPIDTAQLDQFNSSFDPPKTNKPRPSDLKLKLPRSFKANSVRRPQYSSINNYKNLEEIFAKNLDKKAWNNTVKSFRNEPRLISQVIQDQNEVTEKSYKNKSGYFKQTKALEANTERKWQEVDWGQTVLDKYASSNLLEFNFLRDLNIFSHYEIEDLLQEDFSIGNYEAVFVKAVRTLEKLVQELMLPKGNFVVPGKSLENVETVLKECDKLFRARALVVKILSLIHAREEMLLKIMRFDEENEELAENFEELQVISQDILQTIGFLSQSGLYLAEFVYLGGNYAQKILLDESNILQLFPALRKNEEFRL